MSLSPVDPVELHLVREELRIRKRLRELRRENGIEFYEPHPKQELFHAAASYRFRYARTGNRFGKSEMGAAEDVAFAIGYRPWYPVGHPLRTLGIPLHPTKGVIVTTDWDKSTEIFTEVGGERPGKLIRYIPKDCLLGMTRNHSGSVDKILVKHITGGTSMIRMETIKSYKQNPLGLESSDWDWCHVDEPCPEGLWKAIVRGFADRGGRAWFTCTPISEPWIDIAFVPSIEDQSKASLGTISDDHLSRWMMTGEMDDNPHLSAEDIRLTLSFYTDEEKDARRRGIPLAYSGLIYKEFSWNDHVLREPPHGWKSWQQPPADYTLRFAIDYHPRKPHAVMFIATSPLDVHYVYDEIWRSCLMSELVIDIKTILQGESTVPGLIDPLADTPNRVTDITPLEEVQRLGLPVIPATKDPHNGILKVKALLKTRDRTGQPIIFFNAACTRTMFEISRGYQWQDDTNKPHKENDDMMENFYRLALQGLDYIEPTRSVDYQPIKPREFTDNVIDFSFFDVPGERKSNLNNRRYRA